MISLWGKCLEDKHGLYFNFEQNMSCTIHCLDTKLFCDTINRINDGKTLM